MEFAIAAISLGFLGSLHCVGMCGPLALALPIHDKSSLAKFFSIINYNVGRALTYSALGILPGLLGKSFVFFGLQQALSVASGLVILLFVFLPSSASSRFHIFSGISGFIFRLKNKLTRMLTKKNTISFFGVGLLNGLLPCGLVYMALAGAIASGSPFNGALFMFLFGLSTVPGMFLIMWFGNKVDLGFRNSVRKVYPVLISIVAVMMIVRGLNLGIPYLSPKMQTETTVTCHAKVPSIKCCHK